MIKSRHRLYYVPFVHDCIPALFPELCAPQTVQDYVDWASGVFAQADRFLVNSATTAADLTKLAAVLGHSAPATKLITLDGGFSSDGRRPLPQDGNTSGEHRLDEEPFILFVASFEPRKNHLAVFRAWTELIARRGRSHTPLLVCVGSAGWQSDAAISVVQSSRVLRSRVRILSGVSDTDLERLYRNCLFTLYPSLYEGWGLPVSEALWYGKVPLVAAVPALRESGGALAEYFDPARPDDLVAKLQRLIDDRPYLAFREKAIWERFAGRTWRAIGQEIIDYLRPVLIRSPDSVGSRLPRSAESLCASPIEIGRHYSLSRNTEMRISAGRQSGEGYRMGEGWWNPEAWGCWLKPGRAELLFRLPPETGATWLQLDLRGNPGSVAEVAVSLVDISPVATTTLEPGQHCRISIPLDLAAMKDGPTCIRIDARGACDLSSLTDGMDQRVVSLGVRGFSLTTCRISPGLNAAMPPCDAAIVV
jgi:glycosyltransferase involved in cell wall biosynthesis